MGKSNRQKYATRESETGAGARIVRLQELIREEVNFLLRMEVHDPRLEGVVITMVELTGDGSCAKLWFTSQTTTDNADKVDALDRAGGYIRNHLAESLGLKRTPELRFRRDDATRAFDHA